MYKIIKRRKPSTSQLLKMTENLHEVHKEYCSVDVLCKQHTNQQPKIVYCLYVADLCQFTDLNVDQLYNRYSETMSGGGK